MTRRVPSNLGEPALRRVTAFLFPVLLLAPAVLLLSCDGSSGQPPLVIMSYNVNNLFDDVDDGTEYPEFDPGRGRWGSEEFEAKLRAIAEVIRKACPGGPDVVALQEVERENALERLGEGPLRRLGYRHRALVPTPDLAAHCALLSRHPISRVGALDPGRTTSGGRQRAILEVEIRAHGHSLYVLNNHWKSKSGGAEVTEPDRRDSAHVLGRRLTTLLERDPDADIVVLGDFNENVDEYLEVQSRYLTALMPAPTLVALAGIASEGRPPGDVLFITDRPEEAGLRDGAVLLFDLWHTLPRKSWGSYVYRGRWHTPDHILLTPGLFDGRGFVYRPGSFRVLWYDDRLRPGTGSPSRAADRPYSDHLPLLVTMDVGRD